ncbi:MAG TPA: hypothetical protein DD437_11080 [Rhodobiaceae bacterium]|nr:hypothetical protein [Rhodobiaceae bacterium]
MVGKLEPVLGLGLALNLAYLNLPMFGFITVISKGVEDCLSGLSKGVLDNVKETPWYKDAAELASIHNLETLDPTERNPWWIRFKSKRNAALFNVLFLWRIGKVLSIAATGFCAIGMVIGVALETHNAEGIVCTVLEFTGVPFWTSIAAFVWPIFCVTSGAIVKSSVTRELHYNLKDLGKKQKEEAEGVLQEVEKAVEANTPH